MKNMGTKYHEINVECTLCVTHGCSHASYMTRNLTLKNFFQVSHG